MLKSEAALFHEARAFRPQGIDLYDGAAMYLSRYSVLQVIDPTACYGPVAPLADLTLSPQPAFPGDLLTVTNTSVGGDRFATWLTDGPDAHTDTILAGSTS